MRWSSAGTLAAIDDPSASRRPIEVLVVCTGNQCRSPMVEAMLRAELERRGAPVVVRSAGLNPPGRPATDEILELLKARGLDGQAHRSVELDPSLVTQADLVIGMAREHVRAAAMEVPGAFAKSFTLKELVRRGAEVGPPMDREPLARWLARLGDGREPRMLMGSSEIDDVADPIGRRFKVFKRMAVELDQLVPAAADLLEPTTRLAG